MHGNLPIVMDGGLVALFEQHAVLESREAFAAFRRYMHPDMKWNWFTDSVTWELQRFYERLIAGKRPKLALMSPPRHGKSMAAGDFMAWVAGKNPDLQTMFASYSEDLGTLTNQAFQRLVQSDKYKRVFPETTIGESGYQCNTTYVEYCQHAGSLRVTTVNGAINGMGLHLGVVDDPVKGRKEALSKTMRDATWNWFTDDFFLRFDEIAGMLVIMTRWHVDDVLGRALEKFKDFRVLRYPAIAKKDERHRKKGEPLFPAFKSLDYLKEREGIMSEASWESEFQQEPFIVGGGQLPIEKMRVLNHFDRTTIRHSIRYFDKAGTDDGGAYTAGVLMHACSDLRHPFVIEHICRGQWSALDREQRIKTVAFADAANLKSYEVIVEQEPGSGGKESAENTIRMLAGLRVSADKVGKADGNKIVRADPFSAQVQHGNVSLLAGAWVQEWYDECETWPAGKYKDQVDAASGAFNKLSPTLAYDTSLSGFQD